MRQRACQERKRSLAPLAKLRVTPTLELRAFASRLRVPFFLRLADLRAEPRAAHRFALTDLLLSPVGLIGRLLLILSGGRRLLLLGVPLRLLRRVRCVRQTAGAQQA